MMIIRPICADDYEVLYQIAEESGAGFTSLPVDETLLKNKIAGSESAFATDIETPGNQGYLFVMQDSETGEVVGTSGVEACVGLEDAFYCYHHGKVVHASRELDVHNTVETLTLCNDFTGTSEICTLFLRPAARQGINGKFLSKFRFLFMTEHRQRFADTVIAEMRGFSDDKGSSPFWQWLEEHFFSLDFPTADYLTGIGKKEFIAELMPKYPIYVNLLSKEAQAVIGKVHRNTQPALKMLLSEGFRATGYVDIFDAGPTVEAQLDDIKTGKNSVKAPVQIADAAIENGELCYVINTKVEGFRAICCHLDLSEDHVKIAPQDAAALNLQDNENVRYARAAC